MSVHKQKEITVGSTPQHTNCVCKISIIFQMSSPVNPVVKSVFIICTYAFISILFTDLATLHGFESSC